MLTGQFTKNGGIALSDGRCVSPPPDNNGDYEWCIAEQEAGMLTIAPYAAPPEPPKSFYSRDLLALLTDDDQTAIDAALAANVTWRRIWNALLAQGDQPITVISDRCIAGWTGLTAALGADRTGELAAALNIPVPAAPEI